MVTSSPHPKLSVVIPVYNERNTIEQLLKEVYAVDVDKEIIIVDDGSTDGTRELLKELFPDHESNAAGRPANIQRQLRGNTVKLFLQERNRGKGAALRCGFQHAEGELVIIQDADLEYHPEDFHKLLDPVYRGKADVVYGSRFLGGPHRVLSFWHFVGNRFLTMLSNMLTNLNLSDVWTCYKLFKREVLETIHLKEDGFGFEPEVTAKVAKGGWRVYEVPISYWGRTYAEGKKITWKDGVKALWYILRYNLFG